MWYALTAPITRSFSMGSLRNHFQPLAITSASQPRSRTSRSTHPTNRKCSACLSSQSIKVRRLPDRIRSEVRDKSEPDLMKRFIEWGENCMVSSPSLWEGLREGAKLDARQTLSPALSQRRGRKTL